MSERKGQAQIPFFIPKPQSVEMLEGTTELSPDVRLATSNVIPYMRKTMRSIFTAAAIRVVANKKRFVIQVNIVSEDDADWSEVPEASRADYYKMEILNNVVTISSPSQVGAIWGVQSFADLYQASGPDSLIPNCVIKDWPAIPVRGAAVGASVLSRRMRLDEYGTVIDRLARSRMNTLIVGLYGAPGAPDPALGDTLLVPFPEYPELATSSALDWETPHPAPVPEGAFDESPPAMATEDFLPGLLAYGRERGLTVVPSLDFSEMTDRLKPFCPTAGDTGDDAFRSFVEGLYGSFMKRYCPDGLDYFHVSLAGIDESKVGDYAVWLVKTLSAQGVERVIVDRGTSGEAAVRSLSEAGLANQVCVLGESGNIEGVQIWSTVNVGGTNWAQLADEASPSVPAGAGDGVIAQTCLDSPWVFDEYLLAVKAWNQDGAEDDEKCRERAMANLAGRFAHTFIAAMPELRKACSALPEQLVSLPVNQVEGGADYIAKVSESLGPDAVKQLENVVSHASAAYEKLLPLVTTEGESTPFPTVTKTFIGEAARMAGVARACAVAINGGPLDDSTMDQVVEDFTEAMQGVSLYKPRHMAPMLLSSMTMLRNHLRSMA